MVIGLISPILPLLAQVPIYTKSAPPPIPALADLPLVSSISKDGITWMFQTPVRSGQFINGDYYVVGPVTITNITPPGTNGRNGTMKNLRPNPSGSGFDSRIDAGRYAANLRVNLPVTLQPGDMLASSISVETIGTTKRVLRPSDDTLSPVRTVSLLTCVANPLPPDAFRPGYCGTDRIQFYSRDLRRDLLPKLTPVASTPTLGEFAGYLRRPWIDTVFYNFDTPVEYMPDYGREIGRLIGQSALLLCLNYSSEQKEALLVYFVQYGIDLYSAVAAGHSGWPGHGGYGSGRKLPIVLAGKLLGNAAMQKPPGNYGEDMQTMIAAAPPYGPGWNGAVAMYAGHRGTNGESINPGWGPYEHLQPSNWASQTGESYRRCCTSVAWVGQALAARILGLESCWNHPAFFAYVQRWMTENDAADVAAIRAQTGVDYSASWARQGQAWDAFVNQMWSAYQNYAPPFTVELRRLSDGRLELNWPVGNLLRASDSAASWTPVPGASPITITPSNPQEFFRLVR